jgi:hypothetical protein
VLCCGNIGRGLVGGSFEWGWDMGGKMGRPPGSVARVHGAVGLAVAGLSGGRARGRWKQEERDAVMVEVFDGMMEGRTLREIVVGLGVSESTVRKWLVADEHLGRMYESARLVMAQALAERALELVREVAPEEVSAKRLQVDTLRWAAERMNPKMFGGKLLGAGGKTQVKVQVVEEVMDGVVVDGDFEVAE